MTSSMLTGTGTQAARGFLAAFARHDVDAAIGNRTATFEQNPSSAANLWFLTYRDNSPLRAENWDAFRDPDALTYKAYVNLQADAETKVAWCLEAHAAAGADAALGLGSVALLGHAFTPSRYLCHRFQQRTAVITMTLTSAACPLTGVLENQIRTELAPLEHIDAFRVDWQWIPAWRPADMTDSGREQLRVIGFTI